MASIKDIAQAANVSPATVSQILNHRGSFSEETCNRVFECAKALNYRPNALSRSLRARNTGIVGVLLPSCSIPIYAHALSGIIDICHEHGAHALLSSSYMTIEEEERAIFSIAKRPMDALIYLPLHAAAAACGPKTFRDIPIIGLYRRTLGKDIPCVYADAFQAGYLTTQYLLLTGHRRIAFMAGFHDPSRIDGTDGFLRMIHTDSSGAFTTVDRYRGHLQALREAGLEQDPKNIFVCGFSPDCTEDVFVRILLDHQVDAIICCNDLQAIRGIRFLKANGYRVPEDISVFGYNDDDIASIADVPVSTVHMPMYEMGCRAASLAFELLHHERSDQPLCLPVTLAIRASSAKRAGSDRPVPNRL